MAELYPLFFKPVFKNYIWGGRNLATYGKQLPEHGIVAESWEIASHDDGTTVVANGVYAGQSLQYVFEIFGEDLVGSKNRWAIERGKFPLLVKLLDAKQRLSVQVHPNDAFAQENEGDELGKTEMWVVLDAEPGAAIVYGLAKKVSRAAFRQAIDNGDLEQILNTIPIEKGDHICVPAGTLHSILEGVVLVEIQQNSNTTYRVYDWERKNKDGQIRELHIDQALKVIDFNTLGCKLPPPIILEQKDMWVKERLCQNRYFTTDRYRMQAGAEISGQCDGTTLAIWGVLNGEAEIAGYTMQAVQFVLLPASLGDYHVKAEDNSVLLHTYVV